jgi:hypothetical protein
VHVIVSVDNSSGNCRRQLRLVRDIPSLHVGFAFDIDSSKLGRNSRVSHPLFQKIQCQRCLASNQYQVLAIGRAFHSKNLNVGKHVLKRSQNGTQTVGRQLINLDPLHKHAILAKAFPAQREKFFCKQICDSRHPGMARLADDYVVPVWRHSQISPCVIDYQTHSRIFEWPVIHVLEKP